MPPRRRLQPGRLILASANAGKLAELEAWLRLSGMQMRLTSLADMHLPSPQEDGADFLENAAIKARSAARLGGFPALGDDSGLEVEALGGRPGIFSARWAGAEQDFAAAMERVLSELRTTAGDNRDARFVCALALAWPDGHCEMFAGSVEGEILHQPRGDKGFGYDAIFRPHEYAHSFAEMSPQQKQAISHRTRALELLARDCLPAAAQR